MGIDPVTPALELFAASAGQTISTTGTLGGLRLAGRRNRARAAHMVDARALVSTVHHAYLRMKVAHAANEAQVNPLNIVAVFTGFPVIVPILDRLSQDMGDVLDAWRNLNDTAPDDIRLAAEALVQALLTLMNEADPGWTRPRRHRTYRANTTAADTNFTQALRHFDLTCATTWGPSRRARKAASLELASHPAPTTTPTTALNAAPS